MANPALLTRPQTRNHANGAILFTILLVLAPCAHAAVKGVFIGTAKYKMKGCSDLPDTRFDAADTHNTFVNRGTIDKKDAKLLIGNNTKADIIKAITEQGKTMGKDDTLIIYNSSHGNSKGQLIAGDGYITAKEMANALRAGGAGNVVIINDSCHSAKFQVDGKDAGGKNVAHINAAKENNVAYSSEKMRAGLGHVNGVLTRGVLDGLEGKADFDGDGNITTKELSAYAAQTTRLTEGGKFGTTAKGYNTRRDQRPNHKGAIINLGPPKKARLNDNDDILIPRVIAYEYGEAKKLLEREGFTVSIKPIPPEMVNGTYEEKWVDNVIRMIPKGGTRAPKGTLVTIYAAKWTDVTTMPNVWRKKLAPTVSTIEAVNLKPKRMGKGTQDIVMGQYPKAGTKLIKGSSAKYWPAGKDQRMVPKLLWGTGDKAKIEAFLTRFDVKLGEIVIRSPGDDKWNLERIKKKIYWQYPKPYHWVHKDTLIKVRVAPNLPVVTVPNLKGMAAKQAEEALEKVKLKMRVFDSTTIADLPPEGIYDWEPRRKAYEGDTVSVSIELAEVPDIVGLTEAQARAKLAKLDLLLKRATQLDKNAKDLTKIKSQKPKAGAEADPGSIVYGVFPVKSIAKSAPRKNVYYDVQLSGDWKDKFQLKLYRKAYGSVFTSRYRRKIAHDKETVETTVVWRGNIGKPKTMTGKISGAFKVGERETPRGGIEPVFAHIKGTFEGAFSHTKTGQPVFTGTWRVTAPDKKTYKGTWKGVMPPR